MQKIGPFTGIFAAARRRSACLKGFGRFPGARRNANGAGGIIA
jgi:hypothetical protein